MAQWREFAATNEPGSCLWCGRKLRYKTLSEWTANELHPTRRWKAAKPGDYEDGHFCGLRCAYSFAVALADRGRRLKP